GLDPRTQSFDLFAEFLCRPQQSCDQSVVIHRLVPHFAVLADEFWESRFNLLCDHADSRLPGPAAGNLRRVNPIESNAPDVSQPVQHSAQRSDVDLCAPVRWRAWSDERNCGSYFG